MRHRRFRTHYDNLKVARDAPAEVISAAYRSLAKKYHPDRNSGDDGSGKAMLLINEAYEVLSDPVRRRQHDEWIAAREQSAEDTSGTPSRMGPPREALFSFPWHLLRSGSFWIYAVLGIVLVCMYGFPKQTRHAVNAARIYYQDFWKIGSPNETVDVPINEVKKLRILRWYYSDLPSGSMVVAEIENKTAWTLTTVAFRIIGGTTTTPELLLFCDRNSGGKGLAPGQTGHFRGRIDAVSKNTEDVGQVVRVIGYRE